MNQGKVATKKFVEKASTHMVSIPYESGKSGHHWTAGTATTKNVLVSIPYESGKSGHEPCR